MLKSVLTLLLSKFVRRSDTTFIGSQGLPAFGKPNVDSTVIANLTGHISSGKFVAPSDGYAHLATGNFCKSAFLYVDGNSVSVTAGSVGDNIILNWHHIYLPVSKGQTLYYDYDAFPNQTTLGYITFTKTNGSA